MYVGVDGGGTEIKIGFFESRDPASLLRSVSFASTRHPNGMFEHDFGRLIRYLAHGVAEYGPINAIGIALAGKVDNQHEMLTGAGNLTHWIGRPVTSSLHLVFNCPVVLHNDAAAAAMAEALHGKGRHEDFWFVVWATGVGPCLVRYIDGKPYPLPGEGGHQVIDTYGDRLCQCGQLNCLEAYVGGAGLEKHHGRPAKELTDGEWDMALSHMSDGLHNLVTTQPTGLIVLGGGVAHNQRHRMPTLQQYLASNLKIVDVPRIEVSDMESAGIIGALSLLSL